MNENNRLGSLFYSCIGVFVALVFGIIIGLLFASGFVPNIIVAAWIALGVGVIALLIAFASQFTGLAGTAGCAARTLCCHVKGVMAGAVGSILFSTAGLATGLATTDIGTIVLVGIGAFFFASTLAALFCFSLVISDIF